MQEMILLTEEVCSSGVELVGSFRQPGRRWAGPRACWQLQAAMECMTAGFG
jgi:hypothetical protein